MYAKQQREEDEEELPRQGVFDWGLRGGAREGAGRPRKEGAVCHRKREKISRHCPVHVTAKLVAGLPCLRTGARVVRRALAEGKAAEGFRLCEYSIQSNHLHLLCEAEDADKLSRGLRGLFTRLARQINRSLGRQGQVFEGRAHRHVLRTPAEVKNVLHYMFFNFEKHKTRRGVYMVDLCSSAAWFEGWDREVPPRVFQWVPRERGTVPAESWLLTTGWWKQHGLVPITGCPSTWRPKPARAVG